MRQILAAAVLTLIAGPAPAQPLYTLYDPAQGTLPAAQPWLAYADDAARTGGTATQSVVAGPGARLVTDAAVSAGYSNYSPLPPAPKNPSFPALDRATGYRLDFTATVSQEAHQTPNRAGFSVILLSRDRRGVELGFWAGEVWAQADSPLFTHAEGAAFDTTRPTDFQLSVVGDAYSLTANGRPLLAGPLRDYSASGLPYNLPNYLFLGDDTSSASADVTLGRVSLLVPVPEPAGLPLVAAGLLGLGLRKRRRQAPSAGRRVDAHAAAAYRW